MNIVALKNETFDDFLLKLDKIHKESIQNALERYDKDIYCSIDLKRFKLIRIDERTILSSYGLLKFNRRYYYDNLYKEYIYLLDNALQLPKSKRMTNELILKILELASIMTYSEVGTHLSPDFELSKYTIWKTIKEVNLEVFFEKEINRGNNKIHVQIDEKFIGMTNSINKKKYYTLTIFSGIESCGNKNRLLNKTVISSVFLKDLKARLNEILINKYKVNLEEEIFISGDLATYIQNFSDSIYCCKSKYVPDKFHVFRTLNKELPDEYVDSYLINNKSFQKYLINRLKNSENVDAKKIKKLLLKNPDSFKTYLDPEYLGCSQEGQNSHIYAPRFGKYANRFTPSTIEKLSLVKEAKVMKAKVILSHTKRIIPELIDISIPEYIENIERYVLDTRGMKYETRKIFDAIKYGGM